ncbi:MAG TPA: cbb3-type cytochrome c oxidase subunit I [Terriglobales bacterium]|nr:cbb3-type cytochrome c oxidase subunit I [Terriglobales bacterium]
MDSPLLGAKLCFVSGLVFLFAGFFLRRAILPSVDIYLHATYFVVGHFQLFLLSSLALWIYGGMYYLGAKWLGLQFNNRLVIAQLGLTLAALIGLNSAVYLRVARVADNLARPIFVRVGLLCVSLFLLGIVVFLAIFLLSSGEKLWRASA